MPYTANAPRKAPDADELRARIPGWGADLDPADRPAVPRERYAPEATGAHWELPPQQPELRPRERSIEHARLTPAFGTSAPLKGASGAIRRLAYARYSEGRAAHWLLLLGADRVDVVESHVASWFSKQPDNPVMGTGLSTEKQYGISSRRGRERVDVNHQWLDPLVVAGPWLLGGWAALKGVRRVVRGARH